jgi:hypothetical protein
VALQQELVLPISSLYLHNDEQQFWQHSKAHIKVLCEWKACDPSYSFHKNDTMHLLYHHIALYRKQMTEGMAHGCNECRGHFNW